MGSKQPLYRLMQPGASREIGAAYKRFAGILILRAHTAILQCT